MKSLFLVIISFYDDQYRNVSAVVDIIRYFFYFTMLIADKI